MKLAIITHTPHMVSGKDIFAYAPYVKEMNLWVRHAEEILVVAPQVQRDPTEIEMAYVHDHLQLTTIKAISFISISEAVKAIVSFPGIFLKIYRAMQAADHIHLRCPGTIGLVGCLAQLFFPKKPKTAKYAGNWDPQARQPLSYRMQKWLLSTTFFTKNMKVLVYGDWPDQTTNIVPFFTATYRISKTEETVQKTFSPPYRFLFVGSLASGKRPLYALQLLKELKNNHIPFFIDIYGEGSEREKMERFIAKEGLTAHCTLHGNRSEAIVEAAYKASHFLLLPSRSEGWPKVVAEAMFWGVIPLASAVSCVPWMLGQGKRGVLLQMHLQRDLEQLLENLQDKELLNRMSIEAQQWSRNYTLDAFEEKIKQFLCR